MLPRDFRLLRDKDFGRIYKKGRFFYSHLFRLTVLVNKNVDKNVGIIVGKNIEKRASVRNLYKRQIRALIYKFLPRLKLGQQIIISLKKKPEDFNVLKQDLEQCLKKAALF